MGGASEEDHLLIHRSSMADQYDANEDVLDQACNSEEIPRGPDPLWYMPIKNMDDAALNEVLSNMGEEERSVALGWDGAAQWEWNIRTALGYAIWRGNFQAVEDLIRWGADVTQTVHQEESSCSMYDAGQQFTALAYCVLLDSPRPIAALLQAGAT